MLNEIQKHFLVQTINHSFFVGKNVLEILKQSINSISDSEIMGNGGVFFKTDISEVMWKQLTAWLLKLTQRVFNLVNNCH